MNKTTIQLIIWGVALVAIVVLAITSSGPKDDVILEAGGSGVAPGSGLTAQVSDGFPSLTSSSDTTPVTPSFMEPVADGDYMYSFNGIQWVFTQEDMNTIVNFRLDGFTRWEGGEPANLERPFGGTVATGACSTAATLDVTGEVGTPLAFATCSGETGVTELALFQNGRFVELRQKTPASSRFTVARVLDMADVIK